MHRIPAYDVFQSNLTKFTCPPHQLPNFDLSPVQTPKLNATLPIENLFTANCEEDRRKPPRNMNLPPILACLGRELPIMTSNRYSRLIHTIATVKTY